MFVGVHTNCNKVGLWVCTKCLMIEIGIDVEMRRLRIACHYTRISRFFSNSRFRSSEVFTSSTSDFFTKRKISSQNEMPVHASDSQYSTKKRTDAPIRHCHTTGYRLNRITTFSFNRYGPSVLFRLLRCCRPLTS